ncbi:hypothetical protein [Pseudooceanicola aestuarii]|nr:hypothetical protein [Pseudooceanicola aestuarii]
MNMKLFLDGYRGMALLVEMTLDRFLMGGVLALGLSAGAVLLQLV